MIRFALPLQKIEAPYITNSGVNLYVYRLDMNHEHISGNKLFKLHYNLIEARKQNKTNILTFGGAFSNHIAATAFAGKEQGFSTIGIIRGEAHEKLNPTLQFAASCGMEIRYVSRSLYQDKKELISYIKKEFQDLNYYIVPEGGANTLGIKGCTEIAQNIPLDFDVICCACGTGTTFTGLVISLKEHQQAIGFQVLKAEGYMYGEVSDWLVQMNSAPKNWLIDEAYHFGGYAKTTTVLMDFIRQFEQEYDIPLDPVYTGKMMYGILEKIRTGYFKKGQTIVAIHTGGLQGNAGFPQLT